MQLSVTAINYVVYGFLSLCVSASAVAQQRLVDLEVIIIEPNDGEVFKSGQTIVLSVDVTNHGPDEILVGDSLYVFLPDGSPTWGTMTTSLAIGETTDLFSTEVTLPTVSNNSPTEICVQLVDDPSTQISVGGDPVRVSYKDPVPGNNFACHTLTIEAEPSSISRNEIKASLLPFPNPTNSLVEIPLENADVAEVKVLIKDLSGRTVLSRRVHENSPTGSITLNVAHLDDGIYIIECYEGENFSSGKLNILR